MSQDRKNQLKRTIAIWGAIAALALGIFTYATFWRVVPAVKEYRSLIQDTLSVKERVAWQKIRRTAEGQEIVIAQGEMPASDFQRGLRLRGELMVKAFRPDPTGAYLRIGDEFMPVRFGWTDSLIGTAWAAGDRYQLIAERGPIGNLIVNAGETHLRDAFIGTTEPEVLKYHGIGTGATAAAETDTGCQTELTTQYNPDNTRATGSLTNNGANVFRTVGTNTVDATAAVTEWCLLSQAATGGGTMWSRVTFSTINLAASDSLQTTYDLTIE